MEVRSIISNLPLNAFIIDRASAVNIGIKSKIVDQWVALDFSGSITAQAFSTSKKQLYAKLSPLSPLKCNIQSATKFHFWKKHINKIVLVLTVFFILSIPALASNISIDTNNKLIINGAQTFPIYIYDMCHPSFAYSTCDPANLTEFTFSAMLQNAPPSTADLNNWFPKYEAARVYFTYRNSYSNNTPFNIPSNVKNSPYFFGYMQLDEPSGIGNNTIANAWNAYNNSKADDPNHPVILNHWHDLHIWYPPTDIITWDYYTIRSKFYNGDNVTWSRENSIHAWDVYTKAAPFKTMFAKQLNKPVYAVLQATGKNTTDWMYPMTNQEMKALTYTALTVNVDGIGYWAYHINDAKGEGEKGLASNVSLLNYTKQIARELNGLNSILILPTFAYSWYGEKDTTNVSISPNPTTSIEGLQSNRFNYLLKRNTTDNKWYLFVVNKGNTSISNVQITLKELSGLMTARTLGLETIGSQRANRTISITNGTFIDTFDGYAAHVYEISANNLYPRYDIDENGIMDTRDLTLIEQHFNEVVSVPYPRYDVNMDGLVNIHDITITGQHFGENT